MGSWKSGHLGDNSAIGPASEDDWARKPSGHQEHLDTARVHHETLQNSQNFNHMIMCNEHYEDEALGLLMAIAYYFIAERGINHNVYC